MTSPAGNDAMMVSVLQLTVDCAFRGMYGEQPPSYPGVEAMMAGGSRTMAAGGSVGGVVAGAADGNKKKKKKKMIKKREGNLAQTPQEGLEEVTAFVVTFPVCFHPPLIQTPCL